IFLTNAMRTLVDDDRRGLDGGGERRMEERDREKAEIDPSSIAIVPIAVPMLSGPGAITSVMVLVNLYPGIEAKIAVLVSIVATGAVSWLVLLAADPISNVIGSRGRLVFANIMSLPLGTIGLQFILNGVS